MRSRGRVRLRPPGGSHARYRSLFLPRRSTDMEAQDPRAAAHGRPPSKAGDWRNYERTLLPPIQDLHKLEIYENEVGGYQAIRNILNSGDLTPDAVVDQVKEAIVRGRAQGSRMICCELARLSSHFLWVGTDDVGTDDGGSVMVGTI